MLSHPCRHACCLESATLESCVVESPRLGSLVVRAFPAALEHCQPPHCAQVSPACQVLHRKYLSPSPLLRVILGSLMTDEVTETYTNN